MIKCFIEVSVYNVYLLTGINTIRNVLIIKQAKLVAKDLLSNLKYELNI